MKAFGLVSLLVVLAIAGYLMIGGGDGNGGPAADSQLGQAQGARAMKDKAQAAMAEASLVSVQQAVDAFEASKSRKPASLDEVVAEGFMQSIPAGLAYDPASGKVSLAPLSQSDKYAALRRPSFIRYLGGASLTSLASQTLLITAGWHLYETTGSAWSLALLGLMNYLPIFLFSLPAGWAADHFDRRKVMTLALGLQALAAAGLFALVLMDGPQWPWYVLLFVAATGRALLTPAAVSFYPQLLAEEELPKAIGWSSANYQAAVLVGRVAGGLLLHSLGTLWALAFASAGPLVFLGLLPALQVLRHPPTPADEPLHEKLLGGFRFVWKDRAIFGALSLDFVTVFFGGVEGIMPIFAKDILHCGPAGLGVLLAASFAGALVMSFVLAHRPVMQKPGFAFLASVAGFGLCMLVFAVSTWFWLSVVALFAAGMLDQVSVLVRQSLVQLRTPEALRGRVQAVNFLFIGSSNELGEVESGVSAGLLGPVGSVLLGGVAVLLAVGAWSWAMPALRELPPLDAKAPA